MSSVNSDPTAEGTSLVGRTFFALNGGLPIAMKVDSVESGWCTCLSLDLKKKGRWPTDVVRNEVEKQRGWYR